MQKYYIEIVDLDGVEPYAIQSQWYDTKQEALHFWKQISFCDYTACLMSSVWDIENDTYIDIEFEGYLN